MQVRIFYYTICKLFPKTHYWGRSILVLWYIASHTGGSKLDPSGSKLDSSGSKLDPNGYRIDPGWSKLDPSGFRMDRSWS